MKKFVEGRTTFLASKGEITKKLPVFYNPQMEFDRDLTIAVLNSLGRKNLSYCDLLAGSGIRAIRALNESPVSHAYINDKNPVAVGAIRRNLKLNRLENSAAVVSGDGNQLLNDAAKFDIIDIDPFGPFTPFLDSGLRATKREGYLFLTATDTAPLCGVSPKTCLRRYGSRPLRADCAKEIGLRILLAAVAANAARYDRAVKPLISYNRRHYFRLYLQVSSGANRADSCLKNIHYLQYCFKCAWRGYAGFPHLLNSCQNCRSKLEWAGPLWTGSFSDAAFCKEAASKAENRLVEEMLWTLSAEQRIPTPFYDLHELFSMRKKPASPTKKVFENISSAGYNVSPTHFSKTGIRSDAPDVSSLI